LGSRKYGSIRFCAYSNDHPPRHVHGQYEGALVIVDLRADGNVALADRKDAIRPGNAKQSTVKKILKAALQHYENLLALWEEVHGQR
jgi:Domain of unknown function (DUF4160)